jgi:hypothetical protein
MGRDEKEFVQVQMANQTPQKNVIGGNEGARLPNNLA